MVIFSGPQMDGLVLWKRFLARAAQGISKSIGVPVAD
jgi:hypothetical protein